MFAWNGWGFVGQMRVVWIFVKIRISTPNAPFINDATPNFDILTPKCAKLFNRRIVMSKIKFLWVRIVLTPLYEVIQGWSLQTKRREEKTFEFQSCKIDSKFSLLSKSSRILLANPFLMHFNYPFNININR